MMEQLTARVPHSKFSAKALRDDRSIGDDGDRGIQLNIHLCLLRNGL